MGLGEADNAVAPRGAAGLNSLELLGIDLSECFEPLLPFLFQTFNCRFRCADYRRLYSRAWQQQQIINISKVAFDVLQLTFDGPMDFIWSGFLIFDEGQKILAC